MQRTYRGKDREERRRIPIWCLDQLCNTKVLAPNQDCGSSSVLLHDSRQETANPGTCSVREVNSTSTPDTSFHWQSYLLIPCTQVLLELVCILNKVYINALRLHFLKYGVRFAVSEDVSIVTILLPY